MTSASRSIVRVLVDAHMLGHRETGNETYVRGLLSQLGRLPGLSVAAAIDGAGPSSRPAPGVTYLRLPTTTNVGRLLWGLPRLCRWFGADVLHATYVAPYWSPCPTVVTTHDLSFRRFPQWLSRRERVLFATLVPASLRRAAAIVTDSDHARAELQTYFPRLSARAVSIPLGVGPEYGPVEDRQTLAAVRDRHRLGAGFVLAVGGGHPRKNLDTLVHAFARVRARHREVALAVVGPPGGRAAALPSLARSLGVSSHVRLLGYVSQPELRDLYAAARLFVYPSIYEGFGLPLLEAMACGTPVVAVARSSVPEVVGDAAHLAPVPTVDALARAMDDVLGHDDLAATLVARGASRARRFSWQRTARLTADVYRSVGADHASPQRRAQSDS